MPTLNDLDATLHPPGTLQARVSYFLSAHDTAVTSSLSAGEFLRGIQEGRWAVPVAAVRQALADGRPERADNLKRRLPAVSLSALLRTRARSAQDRVIGHSGWLQGDFDFKANQGMDAEQAHAALRRDPHVGGVFTGPSGRGIKALIRIHGTAHEASVEAAHRHFQKHCGLVLDLQCRDLLRLCFVSHDPAAWWRADEETTPLPLDPRAAAAAKSRAAATRPAASTPAIEGPPLTAWKMADVRELLRHLPRRRPDYETWLRVISGVGSVLPRAEALACLEAWMPAERPGEYEEKWRVRFHQVTIRTVIRMAQQGGFDAAKAARRRRWMGRIRLGRLADTPRPSATSAASGDPADLLGSDPEPATSLSAAEILGCLREQQKGDAALFARQCGHHHCYDALRKRWRSYHPATGLWELDQTGTVMLTASEALTDTYQGLIEHIRDERTHMVRASGDRQTDTAAQDTELRQLNTRCTHLGRASWLTGVLSLAERMPCLLRDARAYDQQRHLLAVANGVLDLDHGRFLDFDRAWHLSVAAPVRWIPDAECPAFDAFLHTCMGGDADLVAYLWRAIGYSLTGYVDHDALFFCHGTGSNGKSTFFLTLRMLLGDALSTTIDIGALLGGSQDNNSVVDYKKAMLEGQRLVLTNEMPENRRLNEHMVKDLLGGEPVTARRPYEQPYHFHPTHKLWVVGNHKPHVHGTDHGIWRRIHLIPWLVTFPPDKIRPRHELLAAFRKELPGILNHAIAGYTDFRARGQRLDPPAAVLRATEEYRREEDGLGNFIEERTEPAGRFDRVRLTEFVERYLQWCAATGWKPAGETPRKLAAMLRHRGLQCMADSHSKTMMVYALRLRPSSNPEPATPRIVREGELL